MALAIASPTLTSAAWLFIRHAYDLLVARYRERWRAQPSSVGLLEQLAMVSAIEKFSSGENSLRFSSDERAGLVRVLGVARDLAAAARLDPRWPSLRVIGDPMAELKRLRGSLERVPANDQVVFVSRAVGWAA